MKELLVSILEQFVESANDVFLQGTLNPEEAYPQKFITFYVVNSPFDDFYDNNANTINWSVHVIFYSNDPSEVLSYPPLIIKALKNEGFIPQYAGTDVISDVDTHTGWAMEFIYPEKYT